MNWNNFARKQAPWKMILEISTLEINDDSLVEKCNEIKVKSSERSMHIDSTYASAFK